MHGLALTPPRGAPPWIDDPQGAVRAVREHWRSLARALSAKAWARLAGVEPKTAERWRAEGTLPGEAAMIRLVGSLTPDFLDVVYEPVVPLAQDNFDARLAVVAMRIEAIRKDLREREAGHAGMAGARGGPAVGRGAAEDGALAGPAAGAVAPARGRAARGRGHMVVSALLIGLTLGVCGAQALGDGGGDVWARAGGPRSPRPAARVIRFMGGGGLRDA